MIDMPTKIQKEVFAPEDPEMFMKKVPEYLANQLGGREEYTMTAKGTRDQGAIKARKKELTKEDQGVVISVRNAEDERGYVLLDEEEIEVSVEYSPEEYFDWDIEALLNEVGFYEMSEEEQRKTIDL